MQMFIRVLVVLAGITTSSLAAKLDRLESIARQLRQGYSYEAPQAPAVPSGLYELPGPPPAPIIPSTTTTTTTTPPPPPPPPAGGYLPPEPDRVGDAGGNFNHFVTLAQNVDTPSVPKVTPTPASAPTPKGFTTTTKKPKKGGMMMMPYMPYDIEWGVQDAESGNSFSHSEVSEGNDVQGEYRVLLPDGRTQVVAFRADPVNGYNAQVTYV